MNKYVLLGLKSQHTGDVKTKKAPVGRRSVQSFWKDKGHVEGRR